MFKTKCLFKDKTYKSKINSLRSAFPEGGFNNCRSGILETNNNKRARPNNRDGCIHDWGGVHCPFSQTKIRGSMEPSREKCTQSFENGQYYCCDSCKQDGGTISRILMNMAKDLWEYCLKTKIT